MVIKAIINCETLCMIFKFFLTLGVQELGVQFTNELSMNESEQELGNSFTNQTLSNEEEQ
jgi:hypothetical protein